MKIVILIFSLFSLPLVANETKVLNSLCQIKNLKAVISPTIMDKLPPKKIEEGLKSIQKEDGKCLEIKKLSEKNKYSIVTKKAERDLSLYLDGKDQIIGIWFGAAKLKNDSIKALMKDLKGLQGKSNLYAIKNNQKVLFRHNEDSNLAIGSTFKIWVLVSLIKYLDERKLSWSEVITIPKNGYSLPSGILQDWPVDSPLTFNTLATLMISRSDNTATDTLIEFLGRGRVERDYPGTKPLLKTSEMFKLKGLKNGDWIDRYLSKALKGKKRVLNRLKGQKLSNVEFPTEPTEVDKIEWFVNPIDICGTLYVLKDQKALQVNPGLFKKKDFKTISYKGGSEPGVINYSHLVQLKSGDYICIAGSWVNTKKAVDENKFATFHTRLMDLLKK